MLAYLVESWSTRVGWRLVGWFPAFEHAMRVATSFPVARVRVRDLEAEARLERSGSTSR